MKKYVSEHELQSALDDFKNDLNASINDAIYGLIDGTIENVSNAKASYIRDYAFYQHQNLVTADFPNATKIGCYSFYKCPELKNVTAPLVDAIDVFAFKGDNSLTSLSYPLATTIGQGACDECSVLSDVNLPLVTSIAPLTFRKCADLTSIDLPAVTSIGTQAFYNSGITSLTLRSNTVCTIEDADAFYFTPIEAGTGYIYVPSNLLNSYKTSDAWSVYANQIRAIA